MDTRTFLSCPPPAPRLSSKCGDQWDVNVGHDVYTCTTLSYTLQPLRWGIPFFSVGNQGIPEVMNIKHPFFPLKCIAAFAVSLDGPASIDPALIRAIAGWDEGHGFLLSAVTWAEEIWMFSKQLSQHPMFTLSTDVRLVTAIHKVAVTHCHRSNVRLGCYQLTLLPTGASGEAVDMGRGACCCSSAPSPGFWGKRRLHHPVPAVSRRRRSAGGKGVRELILPQAFAISSRRKKELDGFGLCLTVSTFAYQVSKEDTFVLWFVDLAALGDRRLKSRHWWYNCQMTWSLNLDITGFEKWKMFIGDKPSKAVLLPQLLIGNRRNDLREKNWPKTFLACPVVWGVYLCFRNYSPYRRSSHFSQKPNNPTRSTKDACGIRTAAAAACRAAKAMVCCPGLFLVRQAFGWLSVCAIWCTADSSRSTWRLQLSGTWTAMADSKRSQNHRTTEVSAHLTVHLASTYIISLSVRMLWKTVLKAWIKLR